jgi:hypothetical protein
MGLGPAVKMSMRVAMETALPALRRRAMRRMMAEGSAWFAAFGAVTAVLGTQLDASAVALGATSILAGQLAAFARLATVLGTGPLGWRFIRSYIDSPGTFLVGSPYDGRHPAAFLLDGMEMHHVATAVHDTATDTGVFDLHQTANQLVTAAVNRSSGSVTVLSALSDGRILQTASLVVVHVPRATVPELARAHRSALHQVLDRGVSPIRADSALFVEAHRREHRAYVTLGPLASCVLDLTGAPPPLACRVLCGTAHARASLASSRAARSAGVASSSLAPVTVRSPTGRPAI